MYFVYYILCFIAWIVALPFIAYSTSKPKHKDSIPARFFTPFSQNRFLDFAPNIFIHACSLGEVRSLEKLVISLASKDSNQILLSVITQTGFKEAQILFSTYKNIQIRYLPFEIFLPLWNQYLQNLKTLVVTEAEVWYMLFAIAKKHHAKTMLINARISTKSYPKYKRFAFFYRNIYKNIDEILVQSQEDTDRFKALGASNVIVYGNLKTLNTPKITHIYDKNATIFLAASTHESEEEIILKAFMDNFKNDDDISLYIAPRHPERFAIVGEMIGRFTKEYGALSQNTLDKKIVLIDKIGELNNLYKIADVVILGGSFVEVGGHNPLEPAFFHTKLISGRYIHNQIELFKCVEGATLCDADTLSATLKMYRSLPHTQISKNTLSLEHLTQQIQGI